MCHMAHIYKQVWTLCWTTPEKNIDRNLKWEQVDEKPNGKMRLKIYEFLEWSNYNYNIISKTIALVLATPIN